VPGLSRPQKTGDDEDFVKAGFHYFAQTAPSQSFIGEFEHLGSPKTAAKPQNAFEDFSKTQLFSFAIRTGVL